MADSFLGAGDIFIDVLTDAGASTGLKLIGNTTKLAIQPDADIKEQLSKGRSTYGNVIASATLKKPAKLSVDMNQLDKVVLGLQFQGTVSTIAKNSGSVTDEVVTAAHDAYVPLANRGVSSVVVTNSAGDTTYSGTTDYSFDARKGWLYVKSTGTITNGQSLKVDYSYGAEAGYKIQGANKETIRVKIVMDGKNLTNGKAGYLTIFDAKVKPKGELDFLKDDFTACELEGTMLTPTGQDYPFLWEEID